MSIALPALANKLDEFVTDQMAEYVVGLSALATRIGLRHIPFGEIRVRWSARPPLARLEAALKERLPLAARPDPALGGKLARALGQKPRLSVEEIRLWTSRATRGVTEFYLNEFALWSESLARQLEEATTAQLVTALARPDLPAIPDLPARIEELSQLEQRLDTPAAVPLPPAATVAAWLTAFRPNPA